MQKILFLFTCFAFSLSVTAQLHTDSVLVDGNYRTFHYKKPGAGHSSSLLFVIHGSGGDGKGMVKGAARLDAIAGQEDVLLVYPDGYKRYWNECRKASTAAANLENIDEAGFFSAMINYFVSRYQVNAGQVFAAGTSGGGHMAYKLALTMPQKIRAITAIVANLPDAANLDCGEAKVAVPVMIINGTADSTNPYNGGEVKVSEVRLGTVRSTDETFAYWWKLAGYTGAPAKENLPDTDPADGKTVEKYSFTGKGKPEIVLLKVINGKHNYPNDIDVYLEAWSFFKRQLYAK